MIDATLTQATGKMETIAQALADQLRSLQVGRATSGLVENISVELYGSPMTVQQVASITVPEANQILITPWDKGALGPIETAIRTTDLGINPVNDGKSIRLVLPQLTEERRKELVKLVGKMAEEARIALRNTRHEAWEKVQTAQKQGEITEDDRDGARAKLDQLIERMNKRVEELAKAKEQELLTL